MKKQTLVIALVFVLAIAPVMGSAEPVKRGNMINADGFSISINSTYPSLSFYKGNLTVPVFSISYEKLVLYSEDMESPEYSADLSSAVWDTTMSNTSEEDGTLRTVVSMSSVIDLSGSSEIKDWGALSFQFLILANGDKAQLGISMAMTGMKPVSSCSKLAIVQNIDGDARFIPDANEMIISDIYYRWDPTAAVDLGGTKEDRNVEAQYSEGSLSLIYPYSENMVEIMHVSGKLELGNTVLVRDYFSDALGYGLGMLAGFGLLGMSYAVKNKKRKSPFDMDSPIYRK